MSKRPSSLVDRALDRLATATARRIEQREGPAAAPAAPAGAVKRDQLQSLRRRVDELEEAVQESRRLNQRLADVVEVVTEVLVPAADRDDDRMKAALERLNKTL